MEELLEFVTFVGIPASGKSTMANEYRKKGYVILSSDERRTEIEEKINLGELTLPDNTNLNATVFESLKQDAITLLKEGRTGTQAPLLTSQLPIHEITCAHLCSFGRLRGIHNLNANPL